jgi:16S rRNA (guanine(966)-N(2))-methyltransferase RsmD
MRIIAGEFRRRTLRTPPDATVTRPIPDRVKESMFALLRGHCEGARVIDLFAGTGAIGLEAISRGAAKCLFVERDRDIARLLQGNIDALGVADRCEVLNADALGAGALARAPRPLTLAFLDPPYPLVRDRLGFQRVLAQVAALVDVLSDDGFVILRTPHPFVLDEADGTTAETTPAPGARRGSSPRRDADADPKRSGGRRDWKRAALEATLRPETGHERIGRGAGHAEPFTPKTPDARDKPPRLIRGALANADDLDDFTDADDLDGLAAFGEIDEALHPPGDDDLPPTKATSSAGTPRVRAHQPHAKPHESAIASDGAASSGASSIPLGQGSGTEPSADDPASPLPPKKAPPDMAVAGAAGPEVHIYGSMAVYWYARAK